MPENAEAIAEGQRQPASNAGSGTTATDKTQDKPSSGGGTGGADERNTGRGGMSEEEIQERIDRAVGARLARERDKASKRILEEHGISDTEELRRIIEDRRASEEERQAKLKEEGKYKQMYEEQQDQHGKTLAQKDAEIAMRDSKLDDLLIEQPLLRILSKPGKTRAINPEQVVTLIRAMGTVRRNGEGEIEIVKQGTDVPFMLDGRVLSLDEYVERFADDNEHLFESSVGRGGLGQKDSGAPKDSDLNVEDKIGVLVGDMSRVTPELMAQIEEWSRSGKVSPALEEALAKV